MARYKQIDTQPKFLPVDLARQLLPGTFEHAVHHLVEHAIDLSPFDERFRNDATGAPAYPPALLLQVVLAAYAHGVVSSRGIERLCREHVTFIALCGDQPPPFTTIADCISTQGDAIARVFAAVVAICDREGLIGREMFAIDGVKLPSNASKRRSGTRADFERYATKLEATAHAILQRHRAADARPSERPLPEKDRRRVERLQRDAAELRAWLERHRAKPDALYDKSRPVEPPDQSRRYQPHDFQYDPVARTCVCPAGKSLYRKGKHLVIGTHVGEQFRGATRDGVPCPVRARCLRHPEKTATRQVMFFSGRVTRPPGRRETHTARMRARIDTPAGRARYAARFGTVEPVFGNLCYNKGLTRFTLRRRAKVDAQWKLFCLVHNIEKLAGLGYAA